MPLDFYYNSGSPVCRLVNIVARELELKINVKDIGFESTMEPWYLKINPQHKVPAINDDGFYLSESRAIITYLVNKYSPNHSLYPTDPQVRAKIDAILHFDNGLIFMYMEALCFPTFYTRCEPPLTPRETLGKHVKKMDFMLKGKKYFVGNSRTLADLSVMTTLTYMESYGDIFDLSPFTNVVAWLKNIKSELPYYEELIQKPIESTRAEGKEYQGEEFLVQYMEKLKVLDEFLKTNYPN